MHLEKGILDEIRHPAAVAMGPREVAMHLVREQRIELLERAELAALVRDHEFDQSSFVCHARRMYHLAMQCSMTPFARFGEER